MQKIRFAAPALYGDHHVLEVRRILLALPGVCDVYASSCFHIIEVDYDPAQVSAEDIASRLERAGYLEELPAVTEEMSEPPHRQAALLEQTRAASGAAIGFQHEIAAQQRSAWPCPGMGLLKAKE